MTDNIQFTLDNKIISDRDIDPVRLPRLLKKHCANYEWDKYRIDRQVSHYNKKVKYALRCVLSNGKLYKNCHLHDLIQMVELAQMLRINLNIVFTNFFEYIDVNQLTYDDCFKLIRLQFDTIINDTEILEICDSNTIKVTNNSNDKIFVRTKYIRVDPCIINYFTNPNVHDFALYVIAKANENQSLLKLAKNVTVNGTILIDLSDRNKALRKIAKCCSEQTRSQIFIWFYQGLKNPIGFKPQLFAAILSIRHYFIDYFEIKEHLIKALNSIITHEELYLEGEQTLEILLSFNNFSFYEANIYLTKHHFDLLIAVIIYAAINVRNDYQVYISSALVVDQNNNCTLNYRGKNDKYIHVVIQYFSDLYKLNQFDIKEILMDDFMRDRLNTAFGTANGMLTKAAIK